LNRKESTIQTQNSQWTEEKYFVELELGEGQTDNANQGTCKAHKSRDHQERHCVLDTFNTGLNAVAGT
jgi:hypothetical protein